MSQMLVVQGEGPQASELFQQGLAVFDCTCGLKPCDRISGPSTWVALFPHLRAPTPGIVRAAASGAARWSCGVGTWFYEGATGEGALRQIAGNPLRLTPDTEAWLQSLDGYFALALEGPSADDLVIVTDRLGMLHLYTVRVGRSVVVCTSLLVAAALANANWDLEGCRQFLFTGTVFETPRTLYANVAKLAPGGVFQYRNGRVHQHRKYWDLRWHLWDHAESRGDLEEIAAALDGVFLAVRRHFSRPVMDLTGGLDSRTLCAAMLRRGLEFDVVVNGEEDSKDVALSRRIGMEFGLQHAEPFRGFSSGADWWNCAKASLPLSDGEKDVLIYATTLRVHTRLAEVYDVTINGGMGEILRGYWWELLFPFTGWRGHFDPKLVGMRRFGAGSEIPGLLAHEFSSGLPESFRNLVSQTNAGLERAPNTAQMDNTFLSLRNQRWRGRAVSATSRIWPCVTPFEFHRFLELAVSCPPRLRIRNRLSRRLIEYLNPRLAALPLVNGCPAAPIRPSTAHQFWPLYIETARLAGKRLLLNTGFRLPTAAFDYPREVRSMRLMGELTRLEEVRLLLDPERMATRDLYRPGRLREILAPAQSRPSSTDHLLGRILTLELAARAVRTASRQCTMYNAIEDKISEAAALTRSR